MPPLMRWGKFSVLSDTGSRPPPRVPVLLLGSPPPTVSDGGVHRPPASYRLVAEAATDMRRVACYSA